MIKFRQKQGPLPWEFTRGETVARSLSENFPQLDLCEKKREYVKRWPGAHFCFKSLFFRCSRKLFLALVSVLFGRYSENQRRRLPGRGSGCTLVGREAFAGLVSENDFQNSLSLPMKTAKEKKRQQGARTSAQRDARYAHDLFVLGYKLE